MTRRTACAAKPRSSPHRHKRHQGIHTHACIIAPFSVFSTSALFRKELKNYSPNPHTSYYSPEPVPVPVQFPTTSPTPPHQPHLPPSLRFLFLSLPGTDNTPNPPAPNSQHLLLLSSQPIPRPGPSRQFPPFAPGRRSPDFSGVAWRPGSAGAPGSGTWCCCARKGWVLVCGVQSVGLGGGWGATSCVKGRRGLRGAMSVCVCALLRTGSSGGLGGFACFFFDK